MPHVFPSWEIWDCTYIKSYTCTWGWQSCCAINIECWWTGTEKRWLCTFCRAHFFPSFVRLIVSFSFFLVCDTALEFQLLPLNLMWEEMKDFVPFCVNVSVWMCVCVNVSVWKCVRVCVCVHACLSLCVGDREEEICSCPEYQFSSVRSLDCLGRWGNMRDDSAEILFQSFLRKALVSSSGMDGDVHSLTLFIQHFLCWQQCHSSSKVPWRMVLEKLSWRLTCPNHACLKDLKDALVQSPEDNEE